MELRLGRLLWPIGGALLFAFPYNFRLLLALVLGNLRKR